MKHYSDIFGDSCICVVRVSTDQQDYEGQKAALEKEAEALGLRVIAFVETKESGFRSIDKKEGFNQLKLQLENTGCKFVMATELSRLARTKFVLEAIKEYFSKNKIQLYTKDENFFLFKEDGSINNPETDIVFSIRASMTESEMRDKKKRTQRGLDQLNQAGYSIVGKTLFGYRKVETKDKIYGRYRKTFEIDEKQAEQIRTVFDWFLNGIDGDKSQSSVRRIANEAIARKFHKYLHSKSNIKKLLKNSAYTGGRTSCLKRKNPEYWNYGNQAAPPYLEGRPRYTSYKRIVDQDVFDAVQDRLKRRNNHIVQVGNEYADKSRKHVTILAKKIRCPKCGRFCSGEYQLKEGRFKSFFYRCPGKDSPILSLRYTDFLIWSICRNYYDAFTLYTKKFNKSIDTEEIQHRIDNIQEELDLVEEKTEQLNLNFLHIHKASKAVILEYNRNIKYLENEEKRLKGLISEELKRKANIESAAFLSEETNKTIQFVESNKEGMRKYISWLIDEIHLIYKEGNDYSVFEVIPLRGSAMESKCPPGVKIYAFYKSRATLYPLFGYIIDRCFFNSNNAEFIIGNECIQLKDAFEDPRFNKIDYIPLKVYNDDLPPSQTESPKKKRQVLVVELEKDNKTENTSESKENVG